MMFDEHFPPSCAGTVERWVPTWSKQTDPSGRYVDVKAIINRLVADCLTRAISTHNAKYDSTE